MGMPVQLIFVSQEAVVLMWRTTRPVMMGTHVLKETCVKMVSARPAIKFALATKTPIVPFPMEELVQACGIALPINAFWKRPQRQVVHKPGRHA